MTGPHDRPAARAPVFEAKGAARKEWLRSVSSETRTLIFFESVHRIRASLDDMVAILGADRRAFIGRELSKLHEQCAQGTLAALRAALESDEIPGKGEFVVVVHGAEKTAGSSIDVDKLLTELVAVMPGKQAATIAARVTGQKKNAMYQRMLELTKPES